MTKQFMKKSFKKTKKVTIDNLAIMVAKGFDGAEKDMIEVKKDIGELKEGNKDIRRDILNLGDRFVSYHAFDQLASRVNLLEKSQK